ncbi:hypothetical protein MUK70_17140 [Dyadobacter chenwenxiniae]|uniref:Uncharacterized protein n=1 Tax=Dyadobacter chenwenxiniae TaxID=2906456 RepID=A0A9X1PIW9_9BACT|nr:hypothetical protein [Dyadobacter chenwenxiniae]MCF0060964.1 hypothetical protein [Dyadobacter chenwenxiniae]UON80792.1 hypothetical protein MUK70_17140 [Dyadobacter chenwenxiniae]
MRQTVTVDIINEKAINLLMDMERLELISLRKNWDDSSAANNGNVGKYKGGMQKQSIELVDKQLDELRGGWE